MAIRRRRVLAALVLLTVVVAALSPGHPRPVVGAGHRGPGDARRPRPPAGAGAPPSRADPHPPRRAQAAALAAASRRLGRAPRRGATAARRPSRRRRDRAGRGRLGRPRGSPARRRAGRGLAAHARAPADLCHQAGRSPGRPPDRPDASRRLDRCLQGLSAAAASPGEAMSEEISTRPSDSGPALPVQTTGTSGPSYDDYAAELDEILERRRAVND